MSNLPQEISKRIEDEALQYAKAIPGCLPHIAYRRGATEWAGKAKDLITALETIKEKFPGHHASLIADNALAKYKEATNG